MTVKQLKAELEKHPDHMEVFLDQRRTEFQFGLLNGVYKKEIGFSEDEGDEPIAFDTVVILSED